MAPHGGGEMVEPQRGISIRERGQMFREVVKHIEAINKSAFEFPPVQPGDNAGSYADMMQDPTVSHCIAMIKESILAQGWDIEPAEKSRAALALADDARRNLKDLDIESILDEAMDAIWRGFQPHEIKWRHQQKRYMLDELAAISHDQIAFLLDDRMRITAIKSRSTLSQEDRTVPAEKLWIHTHKPSRRTPAGESILEPAYRAWKSKDRLLQFWGLAIQRFGLPQWMLQIPSSTTPARQAQIQSTFYGGRLDGVYLIPEDVTATQLQPSAWANLVLENAIDYHDNEINKAILLFMPPAQGLSRTTGTSIAELDRATSYRMLRISRALCRSFKEQVIDPLCFANYGARPEQCPSLLLAIPDTSRIATLAAPFAQLIGSGVISPEDTADQLGLPEPGPTAMRDQPGAARQPGADKQSRTNPTTESGSK